MLTVHTSKIAMLTVHTSKIIHLMLLWHDTYNSS
jgi:hypothetical protein